MNENELEILKYSGNFIKANPPQADNSIRQARCPACNVLYRIDVEEKGLCPFCRSELNFYLSLPRFHHPRSKKKRTIMRPARKRP